MPARATDEILAEALQFSEEAHAALTRSLDTVRTVPAKAVFQAAPEELRHLR